MTTQLPARLGGSGFAVISNGPKTVTAGAKLELFSLAVGCQDMPQEFTEVTVVKVLRSTPRPSTADDYIPEGASAISLIIEGPESGKPIMIEMVYDSHSRRGYAYWETVDTVEAQRIMLLACHLWQSIQLRPLFAAKRIG